MKNNGKKGICVCPFCETELSCISPPGISFCKPCGVNIVACDCGELIKESDSACPKCGKKRKK